MNSLWRSGATGVVFAWLVGIGCKPHTEARAHDAEPPLLTAPLRPLEVAAADASEDAPVAPPAPTFEGILRARVAGLVGARRRDMQCSMRDNRALCTFTGEIKLGPLRATSALVDAGLHTISWISKRDKKAYVIDVEEGRDDLSRWMGMANSVDAGAALLDAASDAVVDPPAAADGATVRTVAGIACRDRELLHTRVCVSELRVPAFSVLARLMPLPSTSLADGGLPLRIMTTHAGQTLVAWEVTKIDAQKVPDAAFDGDADVQSVDLLAMLRSFERIGMPVKLVE